MTSHHLAADACAQIPAFVRPAACATIDSLLVVTATGAVVGAAVLLTLFVAQSRAADPR